MNKFCTENNFKIQVHAVHPGIVDTELFKNTNSDHFPWMKKLFYKNPEQGSRAIVYAAISPRIEGKGGSYLANCMRFSHKKKANEVECLKFFRFTCDLLKIENFGELGEKNLL